MDDIAWSAYLIERLPELWQRLGEHVFLTGIATLTGVVIGVPLGMLAYYRPGLRGVLLAVAGILQTIPSLAMLVLLLALFNQIGVLPAIIALIMYALLPVLRNTLAGLQGVGAELIEAARGCGMTEWQMMRRVQLPLAMPVIMAGIRTAAVVGVGIATLSAFIGAGGLGEFINRGLALSNTRLIYLGAVPAALLALLVDYLLGGLEKLLDPKRSRKMNPRARLALKSSLVAVPVLIAAVIVMNAVSSLTGGEDGESGSNGSAGIVRIAAKNFTEQRILGELMAQMIEAHTGLAVERRFSLGGTIICHNALRRGEVDLYAEYTGTALTAILNRPVKTDPDEVLDIVRKKYKEKFDVVWLEPFGFNNAFAITVRREDAGTHGWKTLSDLKPMAGDLTAGFSAEFLERPDGYPGLKKRYGFEFGQVQDLDPSLLYKAIARGAVDAIAAFSTDGRIPAFNLVTLKDDKNLFPPYHAAPIVRRDALKKYPDLRKALAPLGGIIDNDTMMKLNYQVDEKNHPVQDVAREFLRRKHLLN